MKSLLLFVAATTVIASMMVSTTQITKIVYADPNGKSKVWIGEGTLATSHCEKPDDCKGFPLNKVTRNVCEENAGDKCKQVQPP